LCPPLPYAHFLSIIFAHLYDAEKQLTKALPKQVKAADSEALSKAIREHLEQTQNHVNRLEKVFATLDTPANGKP
jgi:ferritin-like metal-binding protein YciE